MMNIKKRVDMKVLVTGATGFVGRRIVKQLLENNFEVVIVTRNIAKAVLVLGSKCKYFQWSDTTELPPMEAFEGVTGVINLLGENLADKKWTDEQKKLIHDSRILGTAKLIEAIGSLSEKPKVLVSTSAVGIYGSRSSEDLDESATTGNDFLAQVCKDWETEANKAKNLGLRVAIIRVGVVLGEKGGALKKMLPIFKLGLGGKMGTGNQYMSWIHVEDLASMYVEAVKDSSIEGVYNGTAPYPATNAEFSRALGKVLKRPALAPAPAFAIKTLLGEMSVVVLEGQKVLPVKFKAKKFRYRYPTLEMTLKETAY